MMNLGKTLSPQQLAGMMDHTFLKASGLPGDIEKLCAEAVSYGFATVMVNPSEIAHCLKCLAGAAVPIGVTIGFPLGQNTTAAKLYEAQDALGLGARELDMVLNVRALQAGALDVVRAELADFARVCREGGAKSKVILETCYLDDAQKQAACRLAVEAGLDFVKTSTGFGSGGATVADVRLMRDAVGGRAGVKASGGIRDLQTALAMVAAGASRLGTSNSVAIIEELKQQQAAKGNK
jgi:deoxyribose-phosphate aldolase